LGGRAIGGIWNPRGLLRQGCLLGAQQQAQRDQNTGRSKNPPVSHGNTHHAASTFSGMKKPVVIPHNPQRRHTLQGPPDLFMVVQSTTFAEHYRPAKELYRLFSRSLPAHIT